MRKNICLYALVMFSISFFNSYANPNIDEINSLLKITPKDPELYFDRGYLYYKDGNYEKAGEDFRTCIMYAPEEVLYCFYKAMSDMKADKKRSAIEGFNKAIKMKPDHAEAFFYLGILYHKVNENTKAEESFGRALELNPGISKYWAAMARFKREQDKISEAISDYEKALELEPDLAIAHYELAWIYYENKNLNSAIGHADKLVFIEHNALFYHTLACISSEKNIKKAIENESIALSLDQNAEYEKKLEGFRHGIKYSEQAASESMILEEMSRKKELEKIRREKIWEKITKDNKGIYTPRMVE